MYSSGNEHKSEGVAIQLANIEHVFSKEKFKDKGRQNKNNSYTKNRKKH